MPSKRKIDSNSYVILNSAMYFLSLQTTRDFLLTTDHLRITCRSKLLCFELPVNVPAIISPCHRGYGCYYGILLVTIPVNRPVLPHQEPHMAYQIVVVRQYLTRRLARDATNLPSNLELGTLHGRVRNRAPFHLYFARLFGL